MNFQYKVVFLPPGGGIIPALPEVVDENRLSGLLLAKKRGSPQISEDRARGAEIVRDSPGWSRPSDVEFLDTFPLNRFSK